MPPTPAPWPREIIGGAIGALVMLAVVLTLGLLGFAPLGERGASLGLAAAFVSVSVGGVLFALLGASALPVAGPSSATALIFAATLAPLARDPALAGRIEPLLAAGGVMVVTMGLLQIAFGYARLGRLAQFVPQPVLAGFMNGVAVLIFAAQWPALQSHAGAFALGAGTAALTWLVAWRWPRAPAQLIGLAVGLLAHALARHLAPALELGATVGPLPAALPLPDLPWRLATGATAGFLWRHSVELLTAALVLALIGGLESALSSLAINQQLDTRHDASRDLLALGVSNVAVGLFGGLPVVVLRARALATLRAGGRGRRAALAGSIAFALMYALLGPALALLPTAVLAGIMLTVAVALVDRWTSQLVRQWRAGERSADIGQSLAVVALVCALTVWKGFVVGVAAGILAAGVLFVLSMNRSLVRSRYSAADEPSRRLYPAVQEAFLEAARVRIVVLELEGALFFGSAERLAREVDAIDATRRVVVLDLRGVGTLDASGALLLQQLATALPRRGLALLLAGVTASNALGRSLQTFGGAGAPQACFADADRAMEAAERLLLHEAGLGGEDTALPLEASRLFDGLSPPDAARLRAHMAQRTLAAGETLFRQGEPGDRLYVLTRGSVSIVAGAREGRAGRRYASCSAGVVFGEAALLDGGGRSADASADTDIEVQVLTQAALDALGAEAPALAAQVYRNIARQLTDRLRRATALRPSARR